MIRGRGNQGRRFAVGTLAIGAVATVGVHAYSVVRFERKYPEQFAEAIEADGVGGVILPELVTGLILYIPYLVLALSGRGARTRVQLGTLGALPVMSVVGWVEAAGEAQGLFIFFLIWPAQVVVALVPWIRWSRRH